MPFPGAPALLNSALGATGSLPVLQIADALGVQNILSQAQWGIYNSSGQLVIAADSTVSFNYVGDATISDYPVEQGGFQSYNKVQNPFQIKMTIALSGTFMVQSLLTSAEALQNGNVSGSYASLSGLAARTALLNSITQAQQSTALLSVVTPEITYANVNVTHNDFDRSGAKGVTLLQVEIWLEEVRVNAVSLYSNTASNNGANPVNTGTVGTLTPTPVQAQTLAAVGTH